MEFHANEGKKVEIEVNGEIYLRHAIKTRFVKQGDSYIDLFREYEHLLLFYFIIRKITI